MTLSNAEFAAAIAAEEARAGLPSGILTSVFLQETGGNRQYLDNPEKFHYPAGADGRRVAGHTGKSSSAFGPFGILADSTAVDPGYGVTPLRSKDLREQTRFAADYLAARIKREGSVDKGLAAYGEGPQYAQKVLSRMSSQTPSTQGSVSGSEARASAIAQDPSAWVNQRISELPESSAGSELGTTYNKDRIDLLIDDIYKEQTALGQASANAILAKGEQDAAQQEATNKLLRELGLDINVTGSALQQTTAAMQQTIADLNAGLASKRQIAQDPILNVLNLASGNRLTRVQDAQIAQSQASIQAYGQALQQMQDVARKQLLANPSTIAAAAAKEVKARADLEIQKAQVNAAKAGIDFTMKLETASQRAETAANNLRMQQERLALQEEGNRIRAAGGGPKQDKVLSAVQQAREDEVVARAKIDTEQAALLGMSADDYRIFRTTYPEVNEYQVTEAGKLTPQMASALAKFGKMPIEARKMYNLAERQWLNDQHESNYASALGKKYMVDPQLDALRKARAEGRSKEERASAASTYKGAIAERKRGVIINDGTPQAEEVNPYVANFYRLEEMAKMENFVKANPVVAEVTSGPLYAALKEKNAGNSPDKKFVSDKEVIQSAVELARTREFTLRQATEQVTKYYQAQIAVNNHTKQFGMIGMPEQENYKVPVTKAGQFDIDLTPPDKEGKATYGMKDLTSEAQVMELLVRANAVAASGFLPTLADYAISPARFLVEKGIGLINQEFTK